MLNAECKEQTKKKEPVGADDMAQLFLARIQVEPQYMFQELTFISF